MSLKIVVDGSPLSGCEGIGELERIVIIYKAKFGKCIYNKGKHFERQ